MKKISLSIIFLGIILIFVYFWDIKLCSNITKITLILLLVTITYIMLLLILMLNPTFGGYVIKKLFIKKYKETQIICSILISTWTCFVFQGEPLWLYGPIAETVLQSNNPNIGTLFLLKLIENHLKILPEDMQQNMAISLTLLDKIILETNLMTPINVNDAIQNYKNLLLQYNIKNLPTNPTIKINTISDRQVAYFMLYCLNNIMEHPLWHVFSNEINSQNHYFYFYTDLVNYIAEKQKPLNIFLFGNIAYVYYQYVENYTYYSFEIVSITTENAQIDIPMEPEINIHPDKPSKESPKIRWAHRPLQGRLTDRSYLSYSTPLVALTVVGLVLVIIIEKIS